MSTVYCLEFAVEAATEMEAISRLKTLGISKADEAKLSDLDLQAGLYFIKSDADETELTDDVYGRLLDAQDIMILSDELSAERAEIILSLSAVVEKQLKKLLICVLPETEKVLTDIVDKHQKHRSQLAPKKRIEWANKVHDFSLGELPRVLEEDVSELAKNQLLSSQGLLSLMTAAEDFDTLKSSIAELSVSKTVWDSINSILESPVEYGYISAQLGGLCILRNEAAHNKTITRHDLAAAKKNQKHLMSYIGNVKSSYRDNLKDSMKNLTDAMKPILESAVRIDPTIFVEYQKHFAETLKPLTDTISNLKLDMMSPELLDIIKQNKGYQSQVAKSMTDVIENIKARNGYEDLVRQFSETSFSESIAGSLKEVDQLKIDINKAVEEIKTVEKK